MRSVVLGLVLPLFIAPTASAETWRAADVAHDVTTFEHQPEPTPCGTDLDGTDPSDARRDITRLAVEHDRDAVTVRVSVRELSRGDSDTIWMVHLLGPGHAYVIDVYRSERGQPLDVFMSEEPDIPDPVGTTECGAYAVTSRGIPCDELAATADPYRDRIELVVPRTCLKRPRWVRVGVGDVGGFTGDADRYSIRRDEWTPSGAHAPGYPPPYGPKVFRGNGRGAGPGL